MNLAYVVAFCYLSRVRVRSFPMFFCEGDPVLFSKQWQQKKVVYDSGIPGGLSAGFLEEQL